MSPHILCIMSHYTDPVLSLRRLEISRATLIPSLAAQTRKPMLHIVVSQHDPHLVAVEMLEFIMDLTVLMVHQILVVEVAQDNIMDQMILLG